MAFAVMVSLLVELHADADARRAVAEARAATGTASRAGGPPATRRSSGRSTDLYTSVLRLGARAPRPGRVLRGRSCSCRACRSRSWRSTRTSCRTTTRASSRSASGRRRGRASRRPSSSPTGSLPPCAPACRKSTSRWSPWRDDTARTPNLATVYVKMTPARGARAGPFAVDGRGPDVDPPANSRRRNLRSRCPPGRGDGWRRPAGRRDPLRHQRPRPVAVAALRAAGRGGCRRIAGRGRRRPSLNLGKPEVQVQLDRAKAADLGVQVERRRRRAAPARRRRPGDDLQRRRRAVRGAPARASPSTDRARRMLGALTVPSSRLGSVALDNVATLHRGRRAGGDRPPQPRAPGHACYASLLPGVSQTPVMTAMQEAAAKAGLGPELPHPVLGPLARARPDGAELPARLRAVAHLHVPDPRRAVRVVAAPGDDPAVAAARRCPSRCCRCS